MREYEWQNGKDFRGMVELVGREATSRKLGLVACAGVQQELAGIDDPHIRAALETAEEYADFRATKEQVKAAKRVLAAFLEEVRQQHIHDKSTVPEWAWRDPEGADWWGDTNTVWPPQLRSLELVLKPSRASASDLLAVIPSAFGNPIFFGVQAYCDLVRDIFGNPFRPIAFSPDWRTDTAVLLAKHVYESRDFGAMPILADALQDAGCDSADILTHCRDAKQVHVRGCWVVDLVLGKE